ncbi:MAG: serine hydrolase, partial [Prochlorococcus sp.]|nr:serine hydrolase [Prochlorococcus sp.]
MASSRHTRKSSTWSRPMRLVVRLVLMGIGLGVITGSALKILAPQVKQGRLSLPVSIPLPSWLLPKGASTDSPNQQQLNNSINRKRQALLPGRFQTKNEITNLSARWQELAA